MLEHFGLDFGTTNSAVVGRLRRNVTFYDDGYDQPYPSLIAVSEVTGEVQAVGREAWNHREELSESCQILSSAKMLLGKDITWRVGPELWTPERVVTEVFKGLRKRVAERGQGAQLRNPVVAIPVGFSPEKRKSLRRAAADAGLTLQGFVSEPTAAVFRNFNSVRAWSTVVVFDWGGGTLDISVLGIRGTTVHEIATVFNQMGGDDIDLMIAEWAHRQVLREKQAGAPPFSGMDSRYRDMMIAQCENAKRMLCEEDIWEIIIPRYGQFGTVNIILTDEEFIGLMRPKIEEALATLDEGVIHRARLSFDQIGCVIMVGGSSKLRGLREAMNSRGWSCDIVFPEDSDWHVADGAAVLASGFGKYVCAQNVGLRLCDDTFYPLLRRGQTIDHSREVATFGLVEDTDNARFVFVESNDGPDCRLTSMDRVLGYLSVPAYGFSNEPIRLETHVDKDLLLHVIAKSQNRGDGHSRTWTYEELRFSYQLPVEI